MRNRSEVEADLIAVAQEIAACHAQVRDAERRQKLLWAERAKVEAAEEFVQLPVEAQDAFAVKAAQERADREAIELAAAEAAAAAAAESTTEPAEPASGDMV